MTEDIQMELTEIFKKGPTEVHEWLKDTLDTDVSVDSFNWLGIAEAAATEAAVTNDVRWAQTAIDTYEYLAEKSPPSQKDSYIFSSMLVRSLMISRLGAVDNHPVLDIHPVIDWFHTFAESCQQVIEALLRWENLKKKQILVAEDIAQLRHFRQIKKRIYVVKLLVESGRLEANDEITRWITLFKLLP